MKRELLPYMAVCMLAVSISYIVSKSVAKHESDILKETVQSLATIQENRLNTGTIHVRFRCIDPYIGRIKRQGSTDRMQDAFGRCDEALQERIPMLQKMPESLRFATFVTIFANRMSPYGESAAQTDREILQSGYNHCGTQSLFVARTIKKFYPDAHVTQLAMNNPLITVHGMVYVKDGKKSMLLDPTSAVVAIANLDDVLAGNPVSIRNIADFYIGLNENIDRFRRYIRGALMNGGIRKEDINGRSELQPPVPPDFR